VGFDDVFAVGDLKFNAVPERGWGQGGVEFGLKGLDVGFDGGDVPVGAGDVGASVFAGGQIGCRRGGGRAGSLAA